MARGIFECSLDKAYSDLSIGTHTFAVRATDAELLSDQVAVDPFAGVATVFAPLVVR